MFSTEMFSSICGEYVKSSAKVELLGIAKESESGTHEEKTWKPPGFHRIIWGLNR